MACAVKNCNRIKKPSSNVHFFPVPKHVEERRAWLHRCGIDVENPIPKKLARRKIFVCEDHFEPCDYRIVNVKAENAYRRVRLLPDILPHKNLPGDSPGERYSFLDDIDNIDPMSGGPTGSSFNSTVDSFITEQTEQLKYSHDNKDLSMQNEDNTDPSVPTDTLLQSQTYCQEESNDAPSFTPVTYVTSPAESSSEANESLELSGEGCSTDVYSQIQTMIRFKSMNYLGISKENLYVIDALIETTGISERDLLLVFRRIRLNEPLEILCDSVGLTAACVGQIFDESVPIIAREMSELIFWPAVNEIRKLLPFSFLNKNSSIQSVIECFEVQIMEPNNPVCQSDPPNKSCNTLKYLLACTPCGLVTFISKAFPGSTSDEEIIRKSDFLSMIKPGARILADSGFKNATADIASAGGVLIRPSDISSGETLSNDESKSAKKIASVRIQVERLIRRFREYKMCAPLVEVPSNLLDKFDDIVIIIAGLVNLQSKLIK